MDEDINDGGRFGARASVLWKPTENMTITPRLVYQSIDMGGFNRDEFFNLYANPYATTRTPVQLGERQQFLLLDETFEDETLILDNVVKWNMNNRVEATYVASYTKRDLLVSRDSSALAGSISIDFGLPPGAVLLPSNLRDTTEVEQMTHEVRVTSNDDSAFQWQAGVFYSNIKRNYSQRLPTPGYDDYLRGAGSYNPASAQWIWTERLTIHLRSDIRSQADSGLRRSDLHALRPPRPDGRVALVRLGRRQNLQIGWRLLKYDANDPSGQNQKLTVASNGFTPRFMVSYDVSDHVAVNAQASQGFRLGGVNDPLNEPICGADAPRYERFQRFKDETLWNYEVGVKSSFETVTLNGSLFYADIDNLGVTTLAGRPVHRVWSSACPRRIPWEENWNWPCTPRMPCW